MDKIELAKQVYEAQAAVAVEHGEPAPPPWDQAHPADKIIASAMVEDVLANPDQLPEDRHNAWVAKMKAAGWRWGAKTIREIKEHLHLLPYSVLGPVQHAKDQAGMDVIKGAMEPPADQPAPQQTAE
jgi:hypothetical protein